MTNYDGLKSQRSRYWESAISARYAGDLQLAGEFESLAEQTHNQIERLRDRQGQEHLIRLGQREGF